MEASYVGRASAVTRAVRERAADPTVEGVLVLAAEGAGVDPETFDPVLCEASVPVFGGVFPEVLFEGRRYTEGAVMVTLSVEPTTTVVTDLSDPETPIGPQLDERVPTPGETTGFVFVDAYASRIGAFVERVFESYGVGCTFLGGGAGSISMEQGPCLFTGEGMVADAAVLTTVELPSSVGVTHGWNDVAGPFRVNEADGTRLSMLGDESAFDVYRRVVADDSGAKLTRENFFEGAKSYPFGISRLHGETIVRDPYRVGDDGSLTCFGEVTEGEYLHVLGGDPASLVEAAGAASRTAMEGAEGDGPVVSFDCISRVLYLEDQFDAELDAIGDTTDPLAGALTIGEIGSGGGGHLEFYNKTVVVAQLEVP
ncbi:histidine kinase [Halobacteriales archaeon QH_10_67_22]|nr:MAG: histidine kinase [Halobacteriales archaeon QH_10_67_22]